MIKFYNAANPVKFAMENYIEEKEHERNQMQALHQFYKNDADKNFTNQFFYSDLQMCWDKSLQFFGRWNETNSGLKIRKGWQWLRV